MSHKLKVIIHRSHIQGGLTNEEVDGIKGAPFFTERMFFKLYDFWKIHITNYIKKWKNYKNIYQSPFNNTPEDNYSDIYHIETNHKAKFIDSNDIGYKLFSRNTNNDEMVRYFRENNNFYLYEIISITETTIECMIYWIPFNFIEDWYNLYGRDGKITFHQMKECISNCNLFDDCDQFYV